MLSVTVNIAPQFFTDHGVYLDSYPSLSGLVDFKSDQIERMVSRNQ